MRGGILTVNWVTRYSMVLSTYSTTVQYYSTVLQYITKVKYYSTVLQYITTVQYYSTVLKYSTTEHYYSTLLQNSTTEPYYIFTVNWVTRTPPCSTQQATLLYTFIFQSSMYFYILLCTSLNFCVFLWLAEHCSSYMAGRSPGSTSRPAIQQWCTLYCCTLYWLSSSHIAVHYIGYK